MDICTASGALPKGDSMIRSRCKSRQIFGSAGIDTWREFTGTQSLHDLISERASILLQGKSDIALLEAGCGSASYFRFSGVVRSVGIDISREQLEANTMVQEKLLGDIQTYPLPKEAFDIVVCWNVLEHLSRPQDALRNLFNAVKTDGLLILGFPNLMSFKGIVTKITPFSFHRLYYRSMKYTFSPFPTYLRLAILPSRVISFAQDQGFSVAFRTLLEGGVAKRLRNRYGFVNWLFALVTAVARIVSFGKCPSLYLDNCALILKKENRNAAIFGGGPK
jgi:SAM-dependent methyltransferase